MEMTKQEQKLLDDLDQTQKELSKFEKKVVRLETRFSKYMEKQKNKKKKAA
jgi:hypothetical protein